MKFLRRIVLAALLFLAILSPARAESIQVSQFRIEAIEEGHVVDANFEIELTSRLEEALNNGVALFFAIEFELVRPRWYWLDEKTANARIDVRFSYNPLLRQYRLSTGSLQRNFSSFADAMSNLSRLRSWLVMDRDRLPPETAFVASLRIRLDTTQLPRPFQISALTDRDLNLTSSWKRISFVTDAERPPR
jgi:hypothetical protein